MATSEVPNPRTTASLIHFCPFCTGGILIIGSALQKFHLHLSPDTLLGLPTRSGASTEELYTVLQNHRIAVNTTDVPDLCKFSFTSSHQFLDPTTGEPTPLQIGMTVNGEGC